MKLRPERTVSSAAKTTTTTTTKSSGPKIVFVKDQLLKFRDSSKDVSPSWLIGKIVKIDPIEMSKSGGRVGNSRFGQQDSIRRNGGQMSSGRFPSSSSSLRNNKSKYGGSSYSSSDSGGYHPRHQQAQQSRASKSSQGSSWQRGVKQPQPPRNNSNKNRKHGRGKHGYDSPPLDGYQPKKTENAWSRDKIKTDDPNEVTLRKCRNQLNKLTPEKFQRISDNILDIAIDNHVVFKGLIYAIFDMALIQPVYSSMYAQLCATRVQESRDCVFMTTRITKVAKTASGKWEI